MELSDCCSARIKTEGVPDFVGGTEVITVHYICSQCGQPCNLQKELVCPYCGGELKIQGFVVPPDVQVECEDCKKAFLTQEE